MASAEDVLNVACGEIGYSRWSDPQAGTKYGRWFAEITGDSYYGESGVPYCAMFVSWCFSQAGATFPAYPSAYCPDIVSAGYAQGATVSVQQAAPGDVVLFDWGHDDEADHVGIVEHNDGYLTTIEGNTSSSNSGSQSNGGCVARKERSYDCVCCVVRPSYDGGVSTYQPTTSSELGDTSWTGKLMLSEWQRQLGTDVDGKISNQPTYIRYEILNHVTTESFDGATDAPNGSQMIQALQFMLNSTIGAGLDTDGFCGPLTVSALQTWLNQQGFDCGRVDGYYGANTSQAVGKALDAGAFRA